jgi:thiol-disulfide isomerase/thioredoxin
MVDDLLEPRLIRLPELAEGRWFNTAHPLDKQSLRGKVALIDFWDYTCVNCLRTLPYLIRWHERYADLGLQIIGIHAPEFKFGRLSSEVEAAIAELGLPYPVLLDNTYENWERFANKAWPTKHLADADGYLRFRRQGEGHYRDTETAIQRLLRTLDPQVALPPLLEPLRAEDAPGAVCYRATPELYAGYQMGGLMGHALGNPEGYAPHSPVLYDAPPPEQWLEGRFYLDGMWRAWPEAVAYAGHRQGHVGLAYSAVSVNAVLSPSADPVETQLGIQPAGAAPLVEVRQDGRYLTRSNAGRDVALQPDGRSTVVVTRARLYELVRNPTFEPHELELTITNNGVAFYTLTFTSCTAPPSTTAADTYVIR